MSRLVIIRGLPGSGKSTFARENFPGVFHVENDMFWIRDGEYKYSPARRIEAEKWAYLNIKKALELGMDVVTSCVYGRAGTVHRLAKTARYYGAEVEVYRMTGDYGSIHSVPQHVIDDMRSNFEDYEGETIVHPGEDY